MSRLPSALQTDFSWLSSRIRKEMPVPAFRTSSSSRAAPSAFSALIFRKRAYSGAERKASFFTRMPQSGAVKEEASSAVFRFRLLT